MLLARAMSARAAHRSLLLDTLFFRISDVAILVIINSGYHYLQVKSLLPVVATSVRRRIPHFADTRERQSLHGRVGTPHVEVRYTRKPSVSKQVLSS